MPNGPRFVLSSRLRRNTQGIKFNLLETELKNKIDLELQAALNGAAELASLLKVGATQNEKIEVVNGKVGKTSDILSDFADRGSLSDLGVYSSISCLMSRARRNWPSKSF